MQDSTLIGPDVHKATISVAVAQGKRGGKVRHGGRRRIADQVRELAEKLAVCGARLHFCHQAGACGHGLYRQFVELGHDCIAVARP